MEKPFRKKRRPASVRDSIQAILSTRWPLSAKEIHAIVQKESNSNVTYQGVHKTIQQLLDEGVLQKEGAKYELSRQFIHETRSWGERVSKAYLEARLQKSPETEERVFPNIIEFGRFLIFEWFTYPDQNKPLVQHWHAMYSLWGLSKEELQAFTQTAIEKKFHVLCQGKSHMDEFLKNAYEKLGARVKLGVACAFASDLFVVGEHVMDVYYEPDVKKTWKNQWDNTKNITDFDITADLKGMMDYHPIRVIIRKDQTTADEIRAQAEQELGKPKAKKPV